MTRFASILALVLALLPSAAAAQETQSISPGDRVRVSTMSGIRLTGRLLSLDAKEITFMPDQTMVPAQGDSESPRSTGLWSWSAQDKAIVGGVLLGSLGALVGGNYSSERWATATPTSAKRSQAGGAPAPSLRFSFRF